MSAFNFQAPQYIPHERSQPQAIVIVHTVMAWEPELRAHYAEQRAGVDYQAAIKPPTRTSEPQPPLHTRINIEIDRLAHHMAPDQRGNGLIVGVHCDGAACQGLPGDALHGLRRVQRGCRCRVAFFAF